MSPDPRTHVFRPDLADLTLRNQVEAENYVEPALRQCLRGVVPMLNAPRDGATLISQICYGEFVDVFETRADGYAWVQNRADHYVGYIPADAAIGESIAMLSNRVTALRTYVYAQPSIKTPLIDELTLGSFVTLGASVDQFWELASGGFVFADHIALADQAIERDYVFTAGRLLHVPYLWGGRTPQGIDCSGFVQLCLSLAGIDVPRDSDLQREALGKPLEAHWRDYGWKRGDVVFFPGHVGIMTGGDSLFHANAHTMDVTVELLADVVGRGNDVLAVATAEDLRQTACA